MARSSAYAVVVHMIVEVLKWYPILFFSNQRSSDSKNMINKYGLRISPCMVLRLISIRGLVPKIVLVKDVVEFLYMLLTISTASMGKPMSSMRTSSRAWSMKPKALQKSIYVR